MTKLKIQKRDVPLKFIGDYRRQETPVLTPIARDGNKADSLLFDRFNAWSKLSRLSENEIKKVYSDEIGAAYIFNEVIKRYLEEVESAHEYIDPFSRMEEMTASCKQWGHYVSFCYNHVIEEIKRGNPRILESKKYYDSFLNVVMCGLERLKNDNIILDYSIDLPHPKAINHWSIFLT